MGEPARIDAGPRLARAKEPEDCGLANGEWAVVATPEDYEAAYRIFKATCERSILNLSDTHRKILDAVYDLKAESNFDDGFSQRKIATKADISVSTVSEHKTFLTKSTKLLYEAEGGGLALVADAEPSWWEKGDLLVGVPRPGQVRLWWEASHSASVTKSAEHTEHPNNKDQIPFTYGEEGVRHSAERQPSTTERLTAKSQVNEGVRRESGDVRQGSEHANGLGKVKAGSENVAFGAFGGFESKDRPQVIAEGLHRLLDDHPEYRQRRPGQIACRLHMSQYTPFAPTEEEIEVVIQEAL